MYMQCMHSWYIHTCTYVQYVYMQILINTCVECCLVMLSLHTVNYTLLHRWDSYYCWYILYIRMYMHTVNMYVHTFVVRTYVCVQLMVVIHSCTAMVCIHTYIRISTYVHTHVCVQWMVVIRTCVCMCTWVRSTLGVHVSYIQLQCTPFLCVCTYVRSCLLKMPLSSKQLVSATTSEWRSAHIRTCTYTHAFAIVHSNMV